MQPCELSEKLINSAERGTASIQQDVVVSWTKKRIEAPRVLLCFQPHLPRRLSLYPRLSVTARPFPQSIFVDRSRRRVDLSADSSLTPIDPARNSISCLTLVGAPPVGR
jgi:hypothetical protein